jgi:hypothetical protein
MPDLSSAEMWEAVWGEFVDMVNAGAGTGDFTLADNYNGANKAVIRHRNRLGSNLYNNIYRLPGQLEAESPEEVRFLVLGYFLEEFVGNYAVGGLKTYIGAYRIGESVQIFDLLNDELVAERVFMGDDPPERIVEPEMGSYYGGYPVQDIEMWIEETIEA